MLTTLMLYRCRFFATQSIAAMMSPMEPLPSSSRTFNDRTETPGAMPAYFASGLPVPATMPVTCVPCPFSSLRSRGIRFTKSTNPRTRESSRSGWEYCVKPESMNATVTPAPV